MQHAAPSGLLEKARSCRALARCCIALLFASLMAIAQVQKPGGGATADVIVSRRPKQSETAPASIRSDVNRVLVPVMVTDQTDHRVQGLGKKDFRVFEDGAERELTEFFIADSPVSVALVFDASRSMRNKLAESRRAIGTFLRMSPQDDEFSLITVRDKPEMIHGLTRIADDIENELTVIQSHGWTALYDGMYLGIHSLKRSAPGRRALLVLSDGDDNHSRYTLAELKNLIRESDVRIFSVSVLGHSRSMEMLAEESGGRAYRVRNLNELPDMAVTLSAEVHSEYVLGFSPPPENRDGRYHKVTVEVRQPEGNAKLRASWRRGYYAPLR